MTRLLLIFALVASLTSFANEKKVSPAALAYFNHSFKQATEVEWSVGDHFYKANFVLNSQHLTAFFSGDGEFLAVTRNISPLQLPVNLQTSLKKQQEGLWITSLFEVASETGTTYYITLEDADVKLVYTSSHSSWNLYQRLAKS